MSNTKETEAFTVNEEKKSEITIIDEQALRNKIYVVRGMKVMLDFELAEIYGYTTTAFNQQVKNNAAKFEGEDFMFELTMDEFRNLISKKLTSSWGGRRKPPKAFSESGVYMLMTVLRGELAIKQSRALIRTFRAMKDYITGNQDLIERHDYLRLSMQVSDTQQTVHKIQEQLLEHEARINSVFEQMSDTVKKSELSPFLLDFSKPEELKEYLFLNGEPARADETYISIYGHAEEVICIVDNYISIKTLRLLQGIRNGVSVFIFSDNSGNHLHANDYDDFRAEFPEISVRFLTTGGVTHDRFIILDYGTKNERAFHCGASSKDAGNKLTSITEYTENTIKAALHGMVEKMMSNPPLTLR